MRASRLFFASLVSLGALAAAGCSVPDFTVDPNFNESDGSVGDSTTDTGSPDVVTDTNVTETLPPGKCNSNLDCIGLGPEKKCNVATNTCVECLLSDDCSGAAYCVANKCEPGCKVDTDCIGAKPGDAVGDAGKADAKPDTAGADAAAATKMKCDTTRRVCIGCTTDDECNPGYICNASTGTVEGDAGPGDAGDDASDAASDAAADGGTTLGGACVPGCTPSHACQSGLDCCVGKCLDTKADKTNCGGCGKTCDTLAHTTIDCVDSACKITACEAPFKDCAGGLADGCETDTNNSNANCGGCGTPVTIANGVGKCEGGLATIVSCNAGFDDCDGKVSTGCEARLDSTTNCGKCGQPCTIANGTGTCGDGTCKVLSCTPGFENCDGIVATGCEINTKSNPNACGSCTNNCPTSGGTPQCLAGVCKYSSCTAGFGDCDGSGSCTTKVTDDINNCGACGRTCTYANATAACAGSTCALSACKAGFGNCNGLLTDGCEKPLDSVTDCGACGTACTRANASATCAGGTCATDLCNTNFGNCDGSDANGCEKSLTSDVNNCGACNNVCSVPNATPSCASSKCVVGTCNAGFANCDADPTSNGCERTLATAFNTCPTAIALADAGGATTICGSGNKPSDGVTTVAVNTYGTRYYRVTMNNCMGGCKAGDMRARFTLTSPPGMAFDLRLFTTNACTTAFASSTSGIAGGTETANWVGSTCATTTIYAEVKYRSGTGCGSASLSVTTAY